MGQEYVVGDESGTFFITSALEAPPELDELEPTKVVPTADESRRPRRTSVFSDVQDVLQDVLAYDASGPLQPGLS